MWEMVKVASMIYMNLGYRCTYSMDVSLLIYGCIITMESSFNSLTYHINEVQDVTQIIDSKDATYP